MTTGRRLTPVITIIPVIAATGSGATRLAAFHSALTVAGLAQFNLIRLSSVIPPGVEVDPTGKTPVLAGGWGDRMYCVWAERRADMAGEQAWAGVGWVQRLDGGGGLFVEHAGASEVQVVDAIRDSLGSMTAGLGGFTEPAWVIAGVICTDRPVCSLVIAPYESATWGSRYG